MPSAMVSKAERRALAAGKLSWPMRQVVSHSSQRSQLPYDIPRTLVIETLECGHEGGRYTEPGHRGPAKRRHCFACAVVIEETRAASKRL